MAALNSCKCCNACISALQTDRASKAPTRSPPEEWQRVAPEEKYGSGFAAQPGVRAAGLKEGLARERSRGKLGGVVSPHVLCVTLKNVQISGLSTDVVSLASGVPVSA